MDFRDHSIITQVAFKGTIDLAKQADLDLTDPEGQARFELIFSYVTNSLFNSIGDPEDRAAQVIQAHFPGAVQTTGTYDGGAAATVVPMQAGAVPPPPQPQQYAMNQVASPLKVKGNQFGPLPDWLYPAAAAKGVAEVYDNRDRIAGSNRPWFKSTSGGQDAPAFWPPKS